MESGGDPPIKDYGALALRKVTNIFGPSNQTLFGNISMQLRRAAESLDYYGKLDYDLEKELIDVLNNDKTAIILVARHLVDLKNIGFPDKKGQILRMKKWQSLWDATMSGRMSVKNRLEVADMLKDFDP